MNRACSSTNCARSCTKPFTFRTCTFGGRGDQDRKSTRLNSSHQIISYAVFCLKKKKNQLEKHNARYSNTAKTWSGIPRKQGLHEQSTDALMMKYCYLITSYSPS